LKLDTYDPYDIEVRFSMNGFFTIDEFNTALLDIPCDDVLSEIILSFYSLLSYL